MLRSYGMKAKYCRGNLLTAIKNLGGRDFDKNH